MNLEKLHHLMVRWWETSLWKDWVGMARIIWFHESQGKTLSRREDGQQCWMLLMSHQGKSGIKICVRFNDITVFDFHVSHFSSIGIDLRQSQLCIYSACLSSKHWYIFFIGFTVKCLCKWMYNMYEYNLRNNYEVNNVYWSPPKLHLLSSFIQRYLLLWEVLSCYPL